MGKVVYLSRALKPFLNFLQVPSSWAFVYVFLWSPLVQNSCFVILSVPYCIDPVPSLISKSQNKSNNNRNKWLYWRFDITGGGFCIPEMQITSENKPLLFLNVLWPSHLWETGTGLLSSFSEVPLRPHVSLIMPSHPSNTSTLEFPPHLAKSYSPLLQCRSPLTLTCKTLKLFILQNSSALWGISPLPCGFSYSLQ